MVAVILVLIILLVAMVLYRLRYSNALLAGAGLSSVVYTAIRKDPRTSIPICTALLLDYWIFHVAYAWRITMAFGLGELFVVSTVLFALVLLGTLSPVPGLSELWTENTGLHGVCAMVPLHLMTFFASAMIIRNVRTHLREKRNRYPNNNDPEIAASTSRVAEVPESRRRGAADNDAVL